MTTTLVGSRRSKAIRRFRRFARSGFAINGVIHFLIGAIAIRLAFGDTVDSADQSGALHQLAETTIGRVLLWAAVAGLVSLGAWQITRAAALFEHPRFVARWGNRVVEAAKDLFYLGLGGTAAIFALGGSTSPSETIRMLTVTLLMSDTGVLILVAIGLTAFGFGIGFISIGVRRSFTKLIRLPQNGSRYVVLTLGVAGYIAKGIALGIVGVIFVTASITRDARQVSGLDGALRALLDIPFGVVLLTLIGVGFILFAIFLMARTRLAKL